MMIPFVITGLPRSRTAWMAEAATIEGHSRCHHEPTLKFDSVGELWAWWSAQPERYVGVSDYHVLFLLETIYRLAQPRTLIILRNPDEVRESLRRVTTVKLTDEGLQSAIELIEKQVENPLVRVIYYDELPDSRAVRECLQWLMPDVPVSLERIRYLQGRHVEGDLAENARLWEEGVQRRAGKAAAPWGIGLKRGP